MTWPGGHGLWLLVHILHWPSSSLGLLQPGSLCPATPRQLIQSPTPMTPGEYCPRAHQLSWDLTATAPRNQTPPRAGKLGHIRDQ